MSAVNPLVDVDTLLERMQRVRASGYNHAEELQGEAKRLMDWKEYVRSRPLLSVAVASLLGFGVVRRIVRPSTNQVIATAPEKLAASGAAKLVAKPDWKNGAFSILTTVAQMAVKHYFSTLAQKTNTESVAHDRFRNPV